MKITVLGIDLAKNVFQLHGVDDHRNVVVRKKLARPKLLPFVAQLAPCRIGTETCRGAPSQRLHQSLTLASHPSALSPLSIEAPPRVPEGCNRPMTTVPDV
jgi:transposase